MIDQKGIHNRAAFQQPVPFMTVTSPTRGLSSKDSAHVPLTDGRHEDVKAMAVDMAAARTASVVINDVHLLPAQGVGALAEAILPTGALDIVQHLARGRLPNVNVGTACSMGWGDFVHAALLQLGS